MQRDPQSSKPVDLNLERRIVNFLHGRGLPGVDALELETANGTVFMRGKLPSSSAKWKCYECCRHVAGVTSVVDEVEVAEEVLN